MLSDLQSFSTDWCI